MGSKHYTERFWPKVRKGDGCWEWTGAVSPQGYGKLHNEVVEGKKVHIQAHRVSYEIHKGKIPDGLVVDHLCRNRSCVNPDHLEAVTFRENLIRGNGMAGRNKRKTHCVAGHPLKGRNLSKSPSIIGRVCKVCAAERAIRYYRESKKV